MNNNATEVGHLERWDLPFSDKLFPAVTAFVVPEGWERINVIVMPKGLGAYPGYLLEFAAAPFLMIYNETCAPPSVPQWFDMLKSIPKSSTVIWHNSPLVKLYDGFGNYPIRHHTENPKLKHYLILGGDSIVETVAYLDPTVTQFDIPQKFTVEYLS
jgi:hypothetical protein